MAITKTTTFKGLNLTDAYYTVSRVSAIKQSTSYLGEAEVTISSTRGYEPIEAFYHNFTIDMISTDNFIKQAYNSLKQQADFIGCKDV